MTVSLKTSDVKGNQWNNMALMSAFVQHYCRSASETVHAANSFIIERFQNHQMKWSETYLQHFPSDCTVKIISWTKTKMSPRLLFLFQAVVWVFPLNEMIKWKAHLMINVTSYLPECTETSCQSGVVVWVSVERGGPSSGVWSVNIPTTSLMVELLSVSASESIRSPAFFQKPSNEHP